MHDILIIGLGQTGASIARYCARKNQTCAAWEPDPKATYASFQTAFPNVPVWQGRELPEEAFHIPLWVVSPGVPLEEPAIIEAKQRGIEVAGDVTLFARENTKPILAVTGSNGKSTVVSLLEKMVAAQGLRPALLGNIGTPVLDGLVGSYDCVVLELSSFQLDLTSNLHPTVSCILNVTPDHLDRHKTMQAYILAKQHIYEGAKQVVCNADDPATFVHRPDAMYFSLKVHEDQIWHYDGESLCFHEKRYPVARLLIHSEIHYANMLAALAIIQSAGYDTDNAFASVCDFQPLPHRLILVAEAHGVKWYDDSKATNVGAAFASIESVSKLVSGKIVIIMGGLAKGATFEMLRGSLADRGRTAILIGEAQTQLEHELKDVIPCVHAASFREAILLAKSYAQANDAVLLAPACASFDMFKGYADRGEQFTAIVKESI